MLREQSLQLSNISWPDEFAKIVGCRRCSVIEWPNLLRDEGENILQPGYVGARYCATRLLLVGQNPGGQHRWTGCETSNPALRAREREVRRLPRSWVGCRAMALRSERGC